MDKKFIDLLEKRRSIRFYQQKSVELEKVNLLLDAARKSPTGANSQKIRYVVIKNDRNLFKKVFEFTKWGGAVTPKRSPNFGDNSADFFIAVYHAKGSSLLDVGAAIMSMMYQAVDLDLGSCWIGAFDKEQVSQILDYDKYYELVSLVAFGYPAESPKSCDINLSDESKYFLNSSDEIVVPKYQISEICTFK